MNFDRQHFLNLVGTGIGCSRYKNFRKFLRDYYQNIFSTIRILPMLYEFNLEPGQFI